MIYSVVTENYGNDTIKNFLKNGLQNTQYLITFQEKFARLRSVKTGEEYLLAKETVRLRHPTYSTNFTKQNLSYSITLTRDTVLSLHVGLSVQEGNHKYVYSPVLGNVLADKGAGVVCLLAKLSDD